MSDIRLLNYKDNSTFSKIKLNKISMKEIIENNLEELLGLTLISSNYHIEKFGNEIIETLAIDENYQLVVIEYREGKFGQTINKGIFYLDYIRKNPSEFRILLTKKKGAKLLDNIIFEPRLISIGDDFNKYDEYAVSQLRQEIDLIKIQAYTKGVVVIEKAFQGIKKNLDLFKVDPLTKEKTQLYSLISEFVLSLGDEVTETGFTNFLAYRRIKNFMYLIFKEELLISLRLRGEYKNYIIKTLGDFNKIKNQIESAYDQN